MSPPPVFTISGQALNVNLASGVVQVSGEVTVQGQVGANLSGCIGIRNCSGQVLNTTGMSVTVNVYSNSGGVTSGDVVTIVSGMNLPLTSGSVVQNSGWAISGEVFAEYQHSGCYLPCAAADGFQASGCYLTSAQGTTYQASGVYMNSGVNLTSSAVVGIVTGMSIYQASGAYQASGVYMNSGCYLPCSAADGFAASGLWMSSGTVWQVSGFAQASGVYALSGTNVMSGGSIYIANGAYGSYDNYASGLTVSGHAFGIIYPGTYRMSIDGQRYQFHAPAEVTLSIIKNVTTLNTAFQRCDNSATYSPTAQAACQALNFLTSGDIIDFQFSTVDNGQATINRVGD